MSADSATLELPQAAAVVHRRQHAVLIIDDDDTLSDVLSDRLRKQGLRAMAAYSGGTGLKKAKAESPSLIVLDLCLPDADGLAICQQLADEPETCSIPVIILSGLDEPGLVRRCRAAGCQYFLRKPYDPNALLVLIRQALRSASDWGGDGLDELQA